MGREWGVGVERVVGMEGGVRTVTHFLLYKNLIFVLLFATLGAPGGDFTHKWYATVGLALCTTMMANTLNPHFAQVVVASLLGCVKRICITKCCAKTPEAMHNCYKPPEFELAPRCGALLNTLFCCLGFAAGMPILVWFACFAMLLTCVCDKYMLLRVCKKPIAYDEVVVDKTSGMLPYAMFIHAAFGVCMLGQNDVFPSKEFVTFEVPGETVFTPVLTIFKRGLSSAGAPYMVLFLAVLAYWSHGIGLIIISSHGFSHTFRNETGHAVPSQSQTGIGVIRKNLP